MLTDQLADKKKELDNLKSEKNKYFKKKKFNHNCLLIYY